MSSAAKKLSENWNVPTSLPDDGIKEHGSERLLHTQKLRVQRPTRHRKNNNRNESSTSVLLYDMGFLSEASVVKCSASNLVGKYIGHTGPKITKVLEKALGKVLFIDEA
jgi:hypothetical protein